VGAESDCEIVDIDLTETLHPDDVGARFGAHLPEGLHILAAEALSLRAPGPEHDLIGFRYRIDVAELVAGDGGATLDARLAAFERAAVFRMRKRTGKGVKEIDARRLVARIERIAPTTVELDVRFTAAGSVKPTDLLAALLDLDLGLARSIPLYKTHAFYAAAPEADAPALAAAAAAGLPA
jgi:radical SAM-linked protein